MTTRTATIHYCKRRSGDSVFQIVKYNMPKVAFKSSFIHQTWAFMKLLLIRTATSSYRNSIVKHT